MLSIQNHPQHPPSTMFIAPSIKSAHYYHRRNPSAPVVAHVQSTKTPGLLSLSKPQQRLSTPRPPKSKPVQLPPPATTSPDKPRGRGTPAKDKTTTFVPLLLLIRPTTNFLTRSTSKPRNPSGPGRSRQPSPPPISSDQSALSDSDVSVPPPANNSTILKPITPTLTAPSGRLAKRRNRNVNNVPNPSTSPSPKPKSSPPPVRAQAVPIPVPVAKNPRTSTTMPLSRSVPVISNFSLRTPLRRTTTDKDGFSFPICDDNDSDAEPSAPARPRGTVTWQQCNHFDSSDPEEDVFGPRTAPLSSHSQAARQYFPSPVPSPTPSTRRISHVRTPTVDSLFNMSFDSGSDNEYAGIGNQSEDMHALFGLLGNKRRNYVGRPASASASKANLKNPLYASSTFQNSPSPEALPPPSFSFASDGFAFKN